MVLASQFRNLEPKASKYNISQPGMYHSLVKALCSKIYMPWGFYLGLAFNKTSPIK